MVPLVGVLLHLLNTKIKFYVFTFDIPFFTPFDFAAALADSLAHAKDICTYLLLYMCAVVKIARVTCATNYYVLKHQLLL